MNKRLDPDDTYISERYWCEVDVVSRSRSLCQRSRSYMQKWFAYKLSTKDWIYIIFICKIDIKETLKLTKGQGHKVKG